MDSVPYRIRRSDRARHARIVVDADGVEVVVPRRMALRHDLVEKGGKIVVLAGVPFGTPGSTNVLYVAAVRGDELRGRD